MFAQIKAWFLAHFLKRYIAPDERRPRRYPEEKPDTDLPRFVDRYAERNSDLETQGINEKVQEAVARLKSQGKF
jgi:hypothetical protein